MHDAWNGSRNTWGHPESEQFGVSFTEMLTLLRKWLERIVEVHKYMMATLKYNNVEQFHASYLSMIVPSEGYIRDVQP